VTIAGRSLALWPYTGQDFTGRPQDPINAVFYGDAEPLRLRAALRRLDGDRRQFGFPLAPPFNCTWREAIGDEQTGYATADGWTGSAVQLACGPYGPLRFHVRFFREGAFTLAAAHFETVVPGTSEHQVLSWELAERLLTVDMLRAGIVAGPPQPSAVISQAPTFREVPAQIFGGLPPQLRALAGLGPDRGIPTDGRASLFRVTKREPIVRDVVVQDTTIVFNQIIPKPFCAGPTDFVRVQGPLRFTAEARVTGGGTYHREHHAEAEFTVTAVNPQNGQPVGPPQRALVTDDHLGSVNPGGEVARAELVQQLFDPAGALQQSLVQRLSAGTRGRDAFERRERCTP
jgi:hypothetical protein